MKHFLILLVYGFIAIPDVCSQGCGGSLQLDGSPTTQEILPPSASTDPIYCLWNVSAPAGEIIELSFPKFKLADKCLDYIAVYDGTEVSQRLLHHLCENTDAHHTVLSTDNHMLLEWVSSNGYNQNESFKAVVKLGALLCQGSYVLDDHKGMEVIRTPNFPGNYPNHAYCEYVGFAPVGQELKLKVVFFHLEFHDHCIYDYMEIRDGPSADSPVMDRKCSIDSPSIVTGTGNALHVRFRSDSSVTFPGFEAIFFYKREPKQRPGFAACTCHDDPHCVTYNGVFVDGNGNCSLLVTRDGCLNGLPAADWSFQILIDVLNGWPKQVLVVVSRKEANTSGDVTMRMVIEGPDLALYNGSYKITLNNLWTSPYAKARLLNGPKTTMLLLLPTLGVTVLFRVKPRTLSVLIPEWLTPNMCGLCGYNTDDMVLGNNAIRTTTLSKATYSDSWIRSNSYEMNTSNCKTE